MAVMSRKKKAIAQGWNAINKQRDKTDQQIETKKEVTKEEHEERIKKLRELGLIK